MSDMSIKQYSGDVIKQRLNLRYKLLPFRRFRFIIGYDFARYHVPDPRSPLFSKVPSISTSATVVYKVVTHIHVQCSRVVYMFVAINNNYLAKYFPTVVAIFSRAGCFETFFPLSEILLCKALGLKI